MRAYGFDSSWILAARVAADLQGAFSYSFSPASIATTNRLVLDGLVPLLGSSRGIAGALNGRLAELLYPIDGDEKPLWTRRELARIGPEFLFEKLVSAYSGDKYGCIVVGSPNGGTASLASHLGAPFLPTQLTLNVLCPLGAASLEEAKAKWGPLIASVRRKKWLRLSANMDPYCDAESVSNACMLRFVLKGMPSAYKRFIREKLANGGTLIHASSFHKGRFVRLSRDGWIQVWKRERGSVAGPDSEMASTPEFAKDVARFGSEIGCRFASVSAEKPVLFGRLLFDATRGQGRKRAVVSMYCAVPPLQARMRCGKFWLPFPDRALFSHPLDEPEGALGYIAGKGVEEAALVRDAVVGREVVTLDEWENALRERFARHSVIGDRSEAGVGKLSEFAAVGKEMRRMFGESLRLKPQPALGVDKLLNCAREIPGVRVDG